MDEVKPEDFGRQMARQAVTTVKGEVAKLPFKHDEVVEFWLGFFSEMAEVE